MYTVEYYSATERNTLESVLPRWMTLPFFLAAHPTPGSLDLTERGGVARSYMTSGGGLRIWREPGMGGC